MYPDLCRRVFPRDSDAQLRKSIEQCIERIFKRAMIDAKSMHLKAGWDRGSFLAASAALISEEEHDDMKMFLTLLERHVEREVYP